MFKRIASLPLAAKIITTVVLVLAIVTTVNYIVFVKGYTVSAERAMGEKGAALTAVADEAKNHASQLYEHNAFNSAGLGEELQKLQAAGRPYSEATIFNTLPVVVGWKSAEQAAKREGLEFHIVSFESRNKDHEPKTASFEEKMLRDLTNQVGANGQDWLVREDDAAVPSLHYMRAIKLTKDCLLCHGNPPAGNTTGKDMLGFRMEGWRDGYMHGAYHVVMPMAPVNAQISAFIQNGLMWTIPLCIGALGAFVWMLRGFVGKPIAALIARISEIRTTNDLTKRVEVKAKDEVGRLGEAFNGLVTTLHDIIAEVNTGSGQIDSGAGQIAGASQSLAQGASEQASSLEQISASVEQMSGMTKQNAENARQANSLADESKRSADRGQEEMAKMSKAVNEIKQSSAEISKIIKVIDEIAFQTNLLALNAAVEAARAGEAGKGFAVVAEEVRNLAQRSAEAAKNTSAMIEESTKRADSGVEIATRVGQALEEIAQSTNKVSTLLSEIASASGEQATGISQINQGVSQLDQVTQQNAGNSEELASSAEEMSSQVASLRELVAQFKVNGVVAAPAAPKAKAPPAAGKAAPAKPAAQKPAKAKAHAKPEPDPEKVIPMTDDEALAAF